MDDEKIRDIGNELMESVRDIFPKESKIESYMDGSRLSFVCSVYWKLGNDTSRPNKPSKIILIIISYEAIEDSSYEQRQQAVKDKFRKLIEAKFKSFNPEHNEPREKSPPNEIWLIVSNMLL